VIGRLAAVALLFAAVSARAVDTTDNKRIDVNFRTAFVFGTIVEERLTTNDEDQVVTEYIPAGYGGFVLGVGVSFEFLRWFTLTPSGSFLMDGNSGQISRKGLDVTFAVHVFGGARRTMNETDDMLLMQRDPFNLSLLVRPAVIGFNPSTTSGTGTQTQIDATCFNIDFGAEYRMDLGDRSSLSFSTLYSLVSLPASATQLRTKLFTIEAAWRVFF
jgi:hypothetical protein